MWVLRPHPRFLISGLSSLSQRCQEEGSDGELSAVKVVLEPWEPSTCCRLEG